jgi:hypothetical protein
MLATTHFNKTKTALACAIQATLLVGLTFAAGNASAVGETIRLSVDSKGREATNILRAGSTRPSISADNRFISFQSDAANLVDGDTNAFLDIFVRDRLTRRTTRVSVASDGTQANNGSRQSSISGNGRYVAFNSSATNLVAGDTNAASDIFVHDRVKKTTIRVSVASDGTQGDKGSAKPTISADGRYVSFTSTATNLVAGDTNNVDDVFVHDLLTKTTSLVTLGFNGKPANSTSFKQTLSANGRFVAFQSSASNLVRGDTNQLDDIFVHDRETKQTTRVSVATDGKQGNNGGWHPAISADGRYVAFWSGSSNLVEGDTNFVEDQFVHDRETKETTRVSVASDGTEGKAASENAPSISADGRYVGFRSWSALAANDDNGVDDVYVHDRLTKTTTLVSVTVDGTSGTGVGGRQGTGINTNGSRDAILSSDGRYMAFRSLVTDIVPNDKNGGWISPTTGLPQPGVDVFFRDLTLIKEEKADLAVSQARAPGNVAPKGSTFSFITTVTNQGTAIANDVNLTNVVFGSDVANLESIEPSQGECMTASPAVCRLGMLAAGDSATVTVTLKAMNKGYVSNHASVNAPPLDPVPGNNINTSTIRISN